MSDLRKLSQLEQEVSTVWSMLERERKSVTEHKIQVAALILALVEAKKDVARYRLAKRAYHAQSPQMDGTFHFCYCIGDVRLPRARSLDAAFDAAIAQEEKPE